jgi:hypothetical protein
MRAFTILPLMALLLLLLLAAPPLRAAEPLPPMAGLSEAQAKERAALFAALAATKNDAEARAVENKLWTFWGGFADAESQRLLAVALKAQLHFDYGNALVAMEHWSSVSRNLPKAGTSSLTSCSSPAVTTPRWRRSSKR